MPRISEPQPRMRFNYANEGSYHTMHAQVLSAVKTRRFKDARAVADEMYDPYWRSVSFSKIASVTHETRDLEAARAAAREIGVSWWQSIATASFIGALAKVKGFAAANAALEETEDFLCRDVARKLIAEAKKH